MIEEYGFGITLLIALGSVIAAYITVYLLSKPLLKSDWNHTTIKLPSTPEEIIRRLKEVSDEDLFVTRLYPEFAKRAGDELLPQGVVFLVVSATDDFSSNYPPPFGGIVSLFVPKFLDALIKNKSAAKFAKTWLKKIEAEVETINKANTPPRKEPEGPIEDDNLFLAIGKIVEIFFDELERWDTKKTIRVEHRNDGINPFYDQTESGLFLEYYYGHPSKIWTPWGYFQFTGSVGYRRDAPWDKVLEVFLKRLGAELFIPERNEKWGVYGPVYAIHKVDDIELPKPQLREPQNYLEYEVAKKAYENMTERSQSATV